MVLVGTIEGIVVCLSARQMADAEEHGKIGQDYQEYDHNSVQR